MNALKAQKKKKKQKSIEKSVIFVVLTHHLSSEY
jgi:hypothetical protein